MTYVSPKILEEKENYDPSKHLEWISVEIYLRTGIMCAYKDSWYLARPVDAICLVKEWTKDKNISSMYRNQSSKTKQRKKMWSTKNSVTCVCSTLQSTRTYSFFSMRPRFSGAPNTGGGIVAVVFGLISIFFLIYLKLCFSVLLFILQFLSEDYKNNL